MVMSFFPKQFRSRIYLTIAFLSLFLFAVNLLQIRPLVVSVNDFLGLFAHLTISYWVGLVLIVFCSITAYLDREMKNDLILLCILIVFALYLQGVAILAEDNARIAWSYYPPHEVTSILSTHHINILSPQYIQYNSWPALHFISATLMYILGISFTSLIKYVPLLFYLAHVIITFAIGKQLKFTSNQCFLLSFLSLACFWQEQYYYASASLALLVFLLIFMCIINLKETNQWNLLILLLFVATVASHLLTSLALVMVTIVYAIYRRKIQYALIFLGIFTAWTMYLAYSVFSVGVNTFFAQIAKLDVFEFFKAGKYTLGPATLQGNIIAISHYAYPLVFFIFMLIALIFYLKDRQKSEAKNKLGICFSWIIGLLVLLVLPYSEQMDMRVFLFAVIPMICALLLSFSNRTVFVCLMILFTVLHIPAHYGAEAGEQTYSSELAGTKYYATQIDYRQSFVYPLDPYITYQNEQYRNPTREVSLIGTTAPPISVLDEMAYLIDSKSSNATYELILHYDPIRDWDTNNRKLTLIYNNGDFKIFYNSKNYK